MRQRRGIIGALGGAALAGLAALAALSGTGAAVVVLSPSVAEASPLDGGTTSFAGGVVVPPDTDDLEHMCLLLTSCPSVPIPPQLFPTDYAACVKKMGEDLTSASTITHSSLLRDCGLHANGCGDLAKCALRGADAKACEGRGPEGIVGLCDQDGRAIACWHGRPLAVRDCKPNDSGQSCMVVRDGNNSRAMCVLGTCAQANLSPGQSRCAANQTHVLSCENGKVTTTDCEAYGLKCAPGEAGSAACATALPACTGAARRCEGNVAVGCHNGHEVKVDCARAGLVCNGGPGATAVGLCYAPAPAVGGCNPADPPACGRDGGGPLIKYCANGKPRTVHCQPYGSTCEKDARGVHCVK